MQHSLTSWTKREGAIQCGTTLFKGECQHNSNSQHDKKLLCLPWTAGKLRGPTAAGPSLQSAAEEGLRLACTEESGDEARQTVQE